ncbi:MAG: methyltransferase regulatory domain-containing protein [Gammaproteobacteria bacterium]|nr:methyltransferase regulatory domain-containing protein [Gammaproteobacteria bacterium]MBU1723200.1 methyltransferase regulatory domain-containing protein [Gammaproteobacteria bacterium]MBU2007225.1 methyltransferase regulatory domain-containing protein [Gammaproteobacteria bacterium]
MVDFYDEFTYETNPFPETHPGNLACLGRLFGINTAPAQQCRVLELGSATGGNLIPMAQNLPGSEFLGVELSAPQVVIGQAIVREAGLENIRLEVGDILELDPARIGQFDYIIAHGVYSWVPAVVREKILQLARESLTPNGIAYISYNVLPGWRMRGSLRDLLLLATRDVQGAHAKHAAAIAALQRLQNAMQETDSDSGRYVQKEIGYLLKSHPSYLLHEYLAGENNPFLFAEFLADANRHGLQYVCETDLNTLFDSTLPAPAQAALAGIEDPLQHEQWMDFVRMRAFRRSLLCRADLPLEREIDIDVFQTFFFSANLRTKGKVGLNNNKTAAFLLPDNTELSIAHPLTKAALLYLQEVHPYTPDFAELLSVAATQVRDAGGARFADESGELLSELFSLYSYRAVLGHLQACLIRPDLPERPQALPLARLQAEQGWSSVATIHHLALSIDAFASRLLELLDGTRTAPELAQVLLEEAAAGELAIPGGKQAQTSGKGMDKEITANVQHLLQVFARHGLLA